MISALRVKSNTSAHFNPSFTDFRIYAKTTFLYFHDMHGWKLPTRMVSDMDAMLSCIFNV